MTAPAPERRVALRTTPARCAGVDGCPDGWLVVLGPRTRGPATWRNAQCAVLANAAVLWERCQSCELVLIDMPVGLSRAPRACDGAARAVLGRAAPRVFPAPCREATRAGSYAQANALSRTLSARGLSKQAWNIVPKIRQLDELLARQPASLGVLRECHPEVCWWGLTGAPILASKKTPQGQGHRLEVLERFAPGAASFCTHAHAMLRAQRCRCALDDVLDAMVAFVAAQAPPGRLRTLPDGPVPRDELGLPMEMVYRAGG